MKNICVILAKKESSRLPNKNFLYFNGFPIVAHSQFEARDTLLFDKVITSTDVDINECPIAESCEIYNRKPDNTKENSTMYDALMEVLEAQKESYDNVCLIHACSPLLKSEYIVKAYDKLINNDYDIVIPACNIGGYVMYSAGDKLLTVNNKANTTNTQQQKMQFYQNVGMFYWCKIDALKRNKSILCNNIGFIELSEMQCQDIDDQDDWDIALWKYGMMNE